MEMLLPCRALSVLMLGESSFSFILIPSLTSSVSESQPCLLTKYVACPHDLTSSYDSLIFNMGVVTVPQHCCEYWMSKSMWSTLKDQLHYHSYRKGFLASSSASSLLDRKLLGAWNFVSSPATNSHLLLNLIFRMLSRLSRTHWLGKDRMWPVPGLVNFWAQTSPPSLRSHL